MYRKIVPILSGCKLVFWMHRIYKYAHFSFLPMVGGRGSDASQRLHPYFYSCPYAKTQYDIIHVEFQPLLEGRQANRKDPPEVLSRGSPMAEAAGTRDRDKLMVQCITNVSAVVVHLRGPAFKE